MYVAWRMFRFYALRNTQHVTLINYVSLTTG